MNTLPGSPPPRKSTWGCLWTVLVPVYQLLTLNFNFNSPLILNNFQFSLNSSISLSLLFLYIYLKNREKILSDLWELVLRLYDSIFRLNEISRR